MLAKELSRPFQVLELRQRVRWSCSDSTSRLDFESFATILLEIVDSVGAECPECIHHFLQVIHAPLDCPISEPVL
jgi:hypothetical protein